MNQTLTTGVVWKKLLRFSIPIFLANLLQALYNVADMLIVGNFVGKAGLSAVHIGGQITLVISTLCMGLCVGSQVVIGQYYGAGDETGVRRTIGTMLSFCGIFGVFLPAVGIPLTRSMLRALETPPEAVEYAFQYTAICLGGTLFVVTYHAIAALQRGMGDSRRPLYFIAGSTISNVLLDLLLVGVFELGPAGAAAATVASQGLACVAAMIYLGKRKFIFQFRLSNFRISGKELRLIVRVGLPSAIQSLAIQFSALFITGLINPYGVEVSAAAGVGTKIDTFCVLPHLAISSAVSAMVAQNIGARQPERAGQTVRSGAVMGLIHSVVMLILLQSFPGFLVGLFDDDPAVIAAGVQYLRVASFACICGGLTVVLNALAIGVGNAVFAMLNAVGTSLLIRVGMTYLVSVVLGRGLISIYYCFAITPLFSATAAFLYYRYGGWRSRSLTGAAPEE